ncbi:hypothetical protein PMAYCL1PPCAC_01316, partial [Pristionchus mayeri]
RISKLSDIRCTGPCLIVADGEYAPKHFKGTIYSIAELPSNDEMEEFFLSRDPKIPRNDSVVVPNDDDSEKESTEEYEEAEKEDELNEEERALAKEIDVKLTEVSKKYEREERSMLSMMTSDDEDDEDDVIWRKNGPKSDEVND